MTEPNIVYIGDEVRVENFGQAWVTWGDENGGDFGNANDSTYHEWPYVTTPDGRPVAGFGGAKIGYYWWHNPMNEGEAWDICGLEIEGVDCAEAAVDAACKLYGEWVREPTEADLKRRGLL